MFFFSARKSTKKNYYGFSQFDHNVSGIKFNFVKVSENVFLLHVVYKFPGVHCTTTQFYLNWNLAHTFQIVFNIFMVTTKIFYLLIMNFEVL